MNRRRAVVALWVTLALVSGGWVVECGPSCQVIGAIGAQPCPNPAPANPDPQPTLKRPKVKLQARFDKVTLTKAIVQWQHGLNLSKPIEVKSSPWNGELTDDGRSITFSVSTPGFKAAFHSCRITADNGRIAYNYRNDGKTVVCQVPAG